MLTSASLPALPVPQPWEVVKRSHTKVRLACGAGCEVELRLKPVAQLELTLDGQPALVWNGGKQFIFEHQREKQVGARRASHLELLVLVLQAAGDGCAAGNSRLPGATHWQAMPGRAAQVAWLFGRPAVLRHGEYAAAWPAWFPAAADTQPGRRTGQAALEGRRVEHPAVLRIQPCWTLSRLAPCCSMLHAHSQHPAGPRAAAGGRPRGLVGRELQVAPRLQAQRAHCGIL